MDEMKIIIPHEGVNEIPKGYKPLMTAEGRLISIVPEEMTKNDVYWLKSEICIPAIDWEQRRYELAKAAMQGYCENNHICEDSSIPSWSLGLADKMISQLKDTANHQ